MRAKTSAAESKIRATKGHHRAKAEGGKTDPKLLLLRFDPVDAQVWLNDHSLLAGVKLLMGRDPKKEYADKTAKLNLTRS